MTAPRPGGRLAASPPAMFAWGLAEALWWPLVPDAGLAVAALRGPRRGPALAIAALAGSVAGGAVGYVLAARGAALPTPLATPAMHDAASGWLSSHGAWGLAAQPLSGVPFKVFVARAPAADVPLAGFLVASAVARGLRMLGTVLLFGAVGTAVQRWAPAAWRARLRLGLAALTVCGFLAGLWLLVRGWS